MRVLGRLPLSLFGRRRPSVDLEEERKMIRDSSQVDWDLSWVWHKLEAWVIRWRQRRAWKRYLRKHYPRRKLP